MSNSLKTVSEIYSEIPPLTDWLLNADCYLAHTCKEKSSEKLEAHICLVNEYFIRLCHAHGLDKIIDQLIASFISENFPNGIDKQVIGNLIKKFFIAAIHFHDFGKVNENFQADPRKMNNPLFKIITNHPLQTSHSTLSAYLFILKHLEDIIQNGFTGRVLVKLHYLIILFSYPILKHHASHLSEPLNGEIGFNEEVGMMRNYVQCYQFDIPDALQSNIGHLLKRLFNQEDKNVVNITFPLYALIKLNFSLLTASDYLATHEYMSGEQTTDLGIFDDRSRIKEIIQNLKTYKHNKRIFTEGNFSFIHPVAISNENINQLRSEMGVELLQTILKHTDKKLFYIEAPTGGGKTNLSMIALADLLEKHPELNKAFYVFPFTTLITQTCSSLKEVLGLRESELVELHSKADFHSKDSTEEAEDGVYGIKKKDYIDHLFALYPLTVLSHVHFFDILKTSNKETNYLLHRLANSVVIIDELQSYNPDIWDKMLYLIGNYAQYFNIHFILMSATLPKIDNLKVGLNFKYSFQELLPNARQYVLNPNFSKRVIFNFELLTGKIEIKHLAEKVIFKSQEYARAKGSVHTIIEFIYKKTASAFKGIIEQLSHDFDTIFVLSGTILEPRRKQIINYLKDKQNRDKNVLLITTQVVESGVDIDMDLGFKNLSLADSDEQLAGRVNRNALKGLSEVYLFYLDEAYRLYGNDRRYKVTEENIPIDEYKRILEEKDFEKIYKLVFDWKNKYNLNNSWADNLDNDYVGPGISKLNYRLVDQKFNIIDQQNCSVFVPISHPIRIKSSNHSEEAVFSNDELKYLAYLGIFPDQEEKISGERVWDVYVSLIEGKKKIDFDISRLVHFKKLQSIMGKYTFSLVAHSKVVEQLRPFCLNADITYGYLYLLHHNNVYDEETGLLEKAFSTPENYFL